MSSPHKQRHTKAEKREKRHRKRQPVSGAGVKQLPRLIKEKQAKNRPENT